MCDYLHIRKRRQMTVQIRSLVWKFLPFKENGIVTKSWRNSAYGVLLKGLQSVELDPDQEGEGGIVLNEV